MKIAPLFAVALVIFALPTFAAEDDEEHVPTQAEMNQRAAAEFAEADAKLNAVYKKYAATLDKNALARLKAAQKAWLAFRDAEAALEAERHKGGSIYPMIYTNVQQKLTEARTAQLQELLDGGENEEESADDSKM